MPAWLRTSLLISFMTLLLASCGGGGGSSQGPAPVIPTPVSKTKWTYMVYIAGDNNLSDAALTDLNEMETVGSSKDVNVVAMAEFSPTYSIGQSANTQRGKILKDSNTSVVSSLSTMGKNVDMGKKESLTEFISWAKANYPADNYALVLWSHGDGWKTTRATGGLQRGALQDESAGSYMSFPDIASAIKDAGGVSLIDFDACLMGMYEIAYQLRNSASELVASPKIEPGAGNPYDTILTDLVTTPTMTARQLADTTATRYGQSYKDTRDVTTKARYDLGTMDATHQALLAVIHYLNAHFTDERGNLQFARDNALNYEEPGNIDLVDFLLRLKAGTSDSALSALIDTAIAKVKLTTFLALNNTGTNTPAFDNIAGLAIFLPNKSQTSTDELLQYAQLTSNTSSVDAWSTIVTQLITGDTGTPIEMTTGNFSYKLVWDDPQADIDLIIWEPSDFYAAWMGTTTANGFFSPESNVSGKAEESYTAASEIAKGSYDVIINYYDYLGACGNPCIPPAITAKLYFRDPASQPIFTLIDTVSLDFSHQAPLDITYETLFSNLKNQVNPYSDWHFNLADTTTRQLQPPFSVNNGLHTMHKIKLRYAGKYSPLRLQQRHIVNGGL